MKTVTMFDLAQRFVGLEEVPGVAANDQIMAMLRLDAAWPDGDEVPWCSAFVNYIAWLMRLPRSKSLRARSWLNVGSAVHLEQAELGDVVVLRRPGGPLTQTQDAPGHVGFFVFWNYDRVQVLGGNQKNRVGIDWFDANDVLSVRRLA